MDIGQPYLALLFVTMLCTAYYGLFLIGEIACTQHGHAALAKDVQIASNKNKFLFILRSSKMHGKGSLLQLVKISSNGTGKGLKKSQSHQSNVTFCPYSLLQKFSNSRPPYKSDEDLFFVLSDGSPVAAHLLQNCLKHALRAENFDASLYTLHSTRSGRALDLFKLGLSVETTKKLGRRNLSISETMKRNPTLF